MEIKKWDISQLPMLRQPTQDTQMYEFTCTLYRQCPRPTIIILCCQQKYIHNKELDVIILTVEHNYICL